MGIATVAAYATIDRDLLHLRYADEIICVSHADYLCRENLVAAAITTGCDAVHPGYGFLSEDAEFCQLVENNDLAFIGPTAEQIAKMGNKISARNVFRELGLQPVPGSGDELTSFDDAVVVADEIGFPVVVKAAFGGGGRGIRVVADRKGFADAFAEAKSEAASVFGNGAVYVERFLDNARHIEVQIIGDGMGSALHLGTRDCSIQRRQQKVIEEAPAPNLDSALLNGICSQAVSAVEALSYRNAGTLEFLYQDGEFYFVEMNTRIQVEHPISEAITGLDLVRMQIETRGSGSLPVVQEEIQFRGSAIECRINAEDESYMPSPGRITRIGFPGGGGVRTESHLYHGYTVPHQFDSLVAKLIVHDADRERAIRKMRRALTEVTIEGIETNRALLLQIIESEKFLEGGVNTRYLEQLSG